MCSFQDSRILFLHPSASAPFPLNETNEAPLHSAAKLELHGIILELLQGLPVGRALQPIPATLVCHE